ncbi:polycystin-1-like protein 3 [Pyxicephalus adspersus]|uniref:polycystin-1-like protein 3 n=1 Tax=Pyxicephalus adspersus TaxID=30357 RepID=UPI003B5C8FB9
MSYHDAKSWCREWRGELVQIGDVKMLNALLPLINDGQKYWVDAQDNLKERIRQRDHRQDTSRQHIIKGRSLDWWKFWLYSRSGTTTTTTKRPKPTRPKTNTTVTPPNLDVLVIDNLNNMTRDVVIQVTTELVAKLDSLVTDIWIVSLVSKASNILTQLVNSSDNLMPETQVNASDILLSLGEQLTGSLTEDVNITSDGIVDAAQSLFHAFDVTLKASLDNYENLTSDQVVHILDSSVASMDYLEYAILSIGNYSVQNHSLSSNLSSITVARVKTSDLTTGSFNTNLPALCRITFPVCSILSDKTGAYQDVLALSVNPFSHLSPVEIDGPVVNIVLGVDEGTIEVSNLTKEIEIVLVKNQSSPVTESKMTMTKDKNIMLNVNITSDNHTVVLNVQPNITVPITLYLGFQEQPNSSFFLQNFSLPYDGLYTLVLSPDMFVNGTGAYYISVTVSNGSVWAQRRALDFTITLFASQCVFWDDYLRAWNDYGCRVGAQTTPSETHCLCNHLTFFASTFLVMPHVVDLSDTLELFANVANNPVGVALLGALVGFFLIVVIWARMKDQEDLKKVRVAILTDNDPAFHCRYMIKICTGHRKGSGTTSQVILTLYGSEGQSDPHLMADSGKEIFRRGAVDVFLLKTRPLGEIHSLRLWHSNSGSSPSWYVHRVTVTDLTAQKTWYFLCDSWLASDLADCQLDRIFPSASKANLMSLRYLLFSGTVEKFLKDHLWFSVWTRCAWSPFTRVQRICCCMCLLFCSLVINIMFWNDYEDEDSETGNFLITLTQIRISVQTSAILVPVNLLIVQMFQLIQVQVNQVNPTINKLRVSLAAKPPVSEAVAQQLLRDLKNIVDFLQKYIIQVFGDNPEDLPTPNGDSFIEYLKTISILIQNYVCVQGVSHDNIRRVTVITAQHCHFLRYVYKILEKLQYQVASVDLTYVSRPIDYIQASNILFDLKELLKSQNVSGAPLPSSLTNSFPVTVAQKRCCRMPKCFTFLCWFFLFAISAFSGYYMVLISLDMTKDKATSWLVSILLSLFQSVFVIPPLKVFAQTIFMFRVLRRINIEDAAEEQQLYGILSLLATRPDWELSGCRDPTNQVYCAPINKNTTSLKKQRVMERKLYSLIHEIVVHMIFLITTMVTAYSDKGSDFNLYSAINKSFTVSYNTIGTIPAFYSWSRNTLLPNLYGQYPGFITDGNCFLVGSPRIRQLRRIPGSGGVAKLYNAEDISSYGPGWSTLRSNDTPKDMWAYNTEEELEGYPMWAQLGYYSGGGFISELGPNSTSAGSILNQMEQSRWIDSLTKVVFVEFNVYNANINLFCLATFILETTMIGGLLPSTDLQIMRLYPTTEKILNLQIVCDILFLIIVLYAIIIQVLRLKDQKWSYFRQTKNLLDMGIIIISCVNTALYGKRVVLRKRDVNRFKVDRTRFISFYETAMIDTAHGYGVAFLVALMTIKLWRLFNLNSNLHLITMTLQKAWKEISGFLFTIAILLVAYGISCNLLFGWSIHSYRTVMDSFVTVFSLLVGIFNYEEVINLDPVLGSLLICTCVVFLVFVIVNIFLSALLNIFSSERKNPTPYEEKEIVDMLMMRISGFLGIREKVKETEAAAEKEKQL